MVPSIPQSLKLVDQASAGEGLYADLAAFYDLFCAHVDYHEQSAFAHRIAAVFCASGGRDYLDLACGTGAHLLQMQKYGYQLNGLDLNPDMLRQAALKVPAARLIEADMAALDQSQAYDLISCFLYSIHYSHPVAVLQTTLQRVWQALKPGGVFVFNAVNAHGALTERPVRTELRSGAELLTFRSVWHYVGIGETLDLHLEIAYQGPDGVRQWQDHHRMTALSVPQLHSLLQACGFEVTIFEHDYSVFMPWDEHSDNVILVACRPLQAPD
jgi:SAM-dependent methyltransferase